MAKKEELENEVKKSTKAKVILPKPKGEIIVEPKKDLKNDKKVAPKRKVAAVQGDASNVEKKSKKTLPKNGSTKEEVKKITVKETQKKSSTTKRTTKSTSSKAKVVKATGSAKIQSKSSAKTTAKKATAKVSNKDKKIENKTNDKTKKTEAKKAEEKTVIEKIKSFISKIIAMQEEEKNKEAILKDEKGVVDKKDKKGKKEEISVKSTPKYMLEYYDLPYRYNETVVKILAQTPKRLFVYWDISDKDREKYVKSFGEDFFQKTYPVLLVYNEDKKYIKEVPINDFANSWYIDIDDPKTNYKIQLGRKFKTKPEIVNVAEFEKGNIILRTDYLPFADSNELEVPNDHVLLEKLPSFVTFRNVKTNEEYTKDVRSFVNVFGENYDVKDFYNENYKEEVSEGMFDMANPSSNLTSSSFK